MLRFVIPDLFASHAEMAGGTRARHAPLGASGSRPAPATAVAPATAKAPAVARPDVPTTVLPRGTDRMGPTDLDAQGPLAARDVVDHFLSDIRRGWSVDEPTIDDLWQPPGE